MALVAMLLLGAETASAADVRGTDELVRQAREAAWADQNQRAASLFAQALEQDPALRERLVREYADQVLYAGRARDAIPLFREALGVPGASDLDRRRARRNLALAYLWAGAYEDAIDAYEEELQHSSGDIDLEKNYIDALIGGARDAAVHDRNSVSADRFAKAISLAPERRAELIREYADQLTYSGRGPEAVNLYREIIATELQHEQAAPELLSSLGLALLWSGQPESARKAYEHVLELRPDDPNARRNLAEALIYLARRDAEADRNASAADLFEQAIAVAPQKRAELLKEYADQLTYSQRAAQAIKLYREMLEEFDLTVQAKSEVQLSLALANSWTGALTEALGGYESVIQQDPDNRRARLGRAEVLGWLEQHEAASSELQRVLEANPDDTEARRRLARSESYGGRHRQAVALAEPLLSANPSDEEAAIIIAESQRWMGRPDLAMETIESLLDAQPDSAKAKRLRAEILDDRRARSSIGTSFSTQSDDLDISRIGFRQAFTLNDGLTTIGPQYRHVRYDPEFGPPVDVDRVGGFLRHRFNDAVEFSSSFFLTFRTAFETRSSSRMTRS